MADGGGLYKVRMLKTDSKCSLQIVRGSEPEFGGGYRVACHYSNIFDNKADATLVMMSAFRALVFVTDNKVTSIENDMANPQAPVAHPFDRFVFDSEDGRAEITFLSVDEPTPAVKFPFYVSDRFSTHYATCNALHFVAEVVAFVVGSRYDVEMTYN